MTEIGGGGGGLKSPQTAKNWGYFPTFSGLCSGTKTKIRDTNKNL